ncbi:hypothetical protein [Pseudoflavonifractor phocaeensis]|uniref:hypothetical protein n=1 Tax=Pseudoflavonifractor phocaeensis TaxID=1870988 RepID=UPI00210C1417|nr:hypothetical protein [Pseudoflavonifractor phocaeensis]MCQ4863769.1 hypothetical protein [Pseudoflavonifractor phocaeensis]
MKQFKGNRKYEDICATMEAAGMTIDRTGLENGGDHCQFKGSWYKKPLTVMYNTFNGQFCVFNGFTGEEIASHMSEELEGEEWYSKLLEALYEPLGA